MCCYFGCLKSWGLCEHDFDWLENTMPHGGWRRLSISFLFKSQSLLVTLFLIPVPRLQLRSHAHLQYTFCQSALLTWARPCFFSRSCLYFLSAHVFRDLFILFLLMLMIFNHSFTRPPAPFIKSKFIAFFFFLKRSKPPARQDRNEIVDNCVSPSLPFPPVFSPQRLTL